MRSVLTEMAQYPELAGRISAWLNNAEPKLIEPVTTALVLAGIVAVLQTDIQFGIQTKAGKKHFTFKLKKKPTSYKILKRFFGIIR
jgi:hypothetical protein